MKKSHFSTIIFSAIAVVMVFVLASCKKEIHVPTEVYTEDMMAILQEEEIDAEKTAAYAKVWEATLGQYIEKQKKENTDIAKNDLKDAVEKAQKVVTKLKVLTGLVEGAEKTTLTGVVMKMENDLESAERFTAGAATSTTVALAAQPAAQPAVQSVQEFASGTTIYVKGIGVRLRLGPGLGYGVYTKLNTGTALSYVFSTGDWYCVNYGGRNLYINKQFATTSASEAANHRSPSSSTGTYLTITGNGVRLRTSPNDSNLGNVYTQLNRGARVLYLGTTGYWYNVSYGGRSLYVRSDYAQF